MKKGIVPVAVYFRIFEIILLVVVIAIVATEVNNIRDSGLYQKKFISRDLALVMDAITNARGNLFYIYNPPLATLGRFDIDFSNGQVSADDQSWPYAVNRNLVLTQPTVKKAEKLLVLTKTGNDFRIERAAPADISFNGLLLECPPAVLNIRSVVIDPTHGYNALTKKGRRGFKATDAQGNTVWESELMRNVGVALQTKLNIKKVQTAGTRNLKVEEAKTMAERIKTINQQSDAAIVSLHAGRQRKNQNVIKAFVNKDADIQTRNFACTLVNEFAKEYPLYITGTAVIPVDLAQLSPEDSKQILLKDRIAVALDLGNIADPKNKLLEEPLNFSEIIARGITK